MPYTLSWNDNVLHIRLAGCVNTQDIRAYEHSIYSDRRFDALDYAIWDGTQIESLDFPVIEAEYSAAFSKGSSLSNSSIKMAIIVTDSAVRVAAESYINFSRYIETPWDMKIFDTIDAASDWLQGP